MAKIKMKKTCEKCRALKRYPIMHCELGHKIKVLKRYKVIPIKMAPCEECEKPTTYQGYIKAIIKWNEANK